LSQAQLTRLAIAARATLTPAALRRARLAAGYTIREVAELLGSREESIQKWETVDICALPAKHLVKLMVLYNIDAGELVKFEKEVEG